MWVLVFIWVSACAASTCSRATWCLPHFNGITDISNVLNIVSDTNTSKPMRRIVPNPWNPSESVLRIEHPQGTVATNQLPFGGATFYANPRQVPWSKSKSVSFCYDVMFEYQFAFNLGGKLPGLYGGKPSTCIDPPRCWSMRYMWRRGGLAELYPSLDAYLQPESYCRTPPFSMCGTGPQGVGDSISRGMAVFPSAKWTSLCQRVTLNSSPLTSDGSVTVFMDGRAVLSLEGLYLSADTSSRFSGIAFHNFFGGQTSTWSSPKYQNVYFKNLHVTVLSTW